MTSKEVIVHYSNECPKGAKMPTPEIETPVRPIDPKVTSAVKSLIGPSFDDETVADIIEIVRSYTERPLSLALNAANKEVLALRARVKELEG